MSAVGSASDNALMESFLSNLPIELLNRRARLTRAHRDRDLQWIEGLCNPIRRHFALDYLSPLEHERLYTAPEDAA